MKRSKVVRPRTSKKVEALIGEDRKAVMRAIRDARNRAGLTQEKAAALKKNRATSTIHRWEDGGVPKRWDDLSEYAHSLEQEIVLRFGPHKEEAPPPDWVTELKKDLLDAIQGAGLTEQERAALRALDATSRPTEVADGVPGEEA